MTRLLAAALAVIALAGVGASRADGVSLAGDRRITFTPMQEILRRLGR
jgi:hypothetical protein